MSKSTFQIAIDGPSGAGKSSIAIELAKKLGFAFINTGAMYRCYALGIINNNVDINDENELVKVLNASVVKIDNDQYFLNGINVTNQLSSNAVALMASKIGTIKAVREKCVHEQQLIANGINCVMEGRDTTSVVLPNATLKVYLDADVELRAKRRYEQNKGVEPYEVVLQKIKERDHQDMNRSFSPLIKVKDAFVIYDNIGYTIEQVVNLIIKEFNERVKCIKS